MFDIMKGHEMDEATAEGIKNGITFVFLAGSGMLISDEQSQEEEGETINIPGQSQEEGHAINIPGFDNTVEPSAGSDGVRINIHEPGAVPNPSFQVWYDYVLINIFTPFPIHSQPRPRIMSLILVRGWSYDQHLIVYFLEMF